MNVGFCAVALESVTLSGPGGHRVTGAVDLGPGVGDGAAFGVGRAGAVERDRRTGRRCRSGPDRRSRSATPLALTAMSTVSGALTAPNWSVTTSWKCSVDRTGAGAVNVGFCAVALESVTLVGTGRHRVTERRRPGSTRR